MPFAGGSAWRERSLVGNARSTFRGVLWATRTPSGIENDRSATGHSRECSSLSRQRRTWLRRFLSVTMAPRRNGLVCRRGQSIMAEPVERKSGQTGCSDELTVRYCAQGELLWHITLRYRVPFASASALFCRRRARA